MGLTEIQLLRCIEEMLDAPAEPLGPLLTRCVSFVLPGETSVFAPSTGERLFKHGGPSWAPTAFESAREHYVAEMPRSEHFRRLGRPISTHQELYDPSAWPRLRFVDEILRPQRIKSQMVASISEGNRPLGILYIGRRGSTGAFRAKDLDLGGRLLRLVSSALCERRARQLLVPLNGLTAREAEVAQQVALGKTNGEIASTLRVSTHTIANHLRHIYDKLGLTNRSQLAVRLAARAS